jgi:short-subunit dehydrogenase
MGPDLHGRRALVTGASGGLGQAIARALHARGATVVLTARRADVLEQLSDELGERVVTLPADLADSHAVSELPGRAGQVDVLVANAGLPASGPLLGFEPDQIDRALDVNLRAPVQLARALAPPMVERGHGHLVFISSIAGKVANPGSSLYSATKFGLRGFAFGLSEDLRGTGVGVTTVFPGFIGDAGMFHDTGVKLPPGVGTRSAEQVAAAVLKGIEGGRAEIDVAPLPQRAGGWIAGVAPSALAAVVRRLGGQDVSSQMAKAQETKR